MLFSKAIRKGAKIRPQAFGAFVKVLKAGETGTCALGAALEAIGKLDMADRYSVLDQYLADRYSVLDQYWPWIFKTKSRCPVKLCKIKQRALGTVSHLNDTHRWTRERIADWLSTIEPPDCPRRKGMTNV